MCGEKYSPMLSPYHNYSLATILHAESVSLTKKSILERSREAHYYCQGQIDSRKENRNYTS